MPSLQMIVKLEGNSVREEGFRQAGRRGLRPYVSVIFTLHSPKRRAGVVVPYK